MEAIKKTVVKTEVNVLAIVDREVLDYMLTVYDVTPESRNFLKEVSSELGLVSNGKAELYKVTDAAVAGSVTMYMDADVFKAHATIVNNEDE